VDEPFAVKGIANLWADLKRARARFLAVDYDGTLAPFRVERMEALPAKDAKEALERIARLPATAVAVVSGRPVGEVTSLLDLPDITVIGSHGWEEKKPGQITRKHPLTRLQAGKLKKGKRKAEAICDSGRIEEKVASVAIHTRGMDAERKSKIQSEIKAAWMELARENELEIRLFNGGIELRAMGWDKGRALETLIEESGPDTYFVYIGDDQTDEDAFRAVRRQGVGIRVGPVDALSFAIGHLRDCEEVVALLNSWNEILSDAGEKGV
jgi:trehalose 6-phosphate phosphatase